MRKHLTVACALAMLPTPAFSWSAKIHAEAPPLRYPDDTRSAFAWAPHPADFPCRAAVWVRVTDQHRPNPKTWEVAWVVLGDEQRFVAFVPKPTGWHVEIFDGEATPAQRYLASGSSPTYAVGEPIMVHMTARDYGVEIRAETRPTDDGTRGSRLAVLICWTETRAPPAWWYRPMEAAIYVEDCTAELEWRAHEEVRGEPVARAHPGPPSGDSSPRPG